MLNGTRHACMLLALSFAAPAAAFERAPLPSEAPLQACPEHGAGFAKIPGTSTCLRVSGRVRAGIDVGATHRAPLGGRFAIDTRVPSDAGPVRSYIRIDAGR